jgi:hypothetical protein
MVEGSINLPWLNHRKHDAEIEEATARATEQDAELSAMRNVACSGRFSKRWSMRKQRRSWRMCTTTSCDRRRKPRWSRA